MSDTTIGILVLGVVALMIVGGVLGWAAQVSAIVIPDGFTREQLLAALDREIRMRERAYPGWVSRGRMSQAAMVREIASMRAIRAVVAQLPGEPPEQPGLFGDAS